MLTDSQGYELVRVGVGAVMADCNGYVRGHRLAAAQKLGRPLQRDDVIHHINGIRTDNRLENLFVGSRSDHVAIHRQMERLALEFVAQGKAVLERRSRGVCRQLESIAMELVRQGRIVFDGKGYRWADDLSDGGGI